MRNLLFNSILFLIFLLATSVLAVPPTVTLKLNPSLDQPYRVREVIQTELNTGRSDGTMQKITTKQQTVYTLTALEKDPTGVRLQVSYEQFRIEESGAAGIKTFDFRKPSPELPQYSPYLLMVIKPFDLKVQPDGQVRMVDGYEPLIAEVLKKYDPIKPNQPAQGSLEFIRKTFADTLGDAALEEKLSELFLPEQTVAVGQTWQRRTILTKRLPTIADAKLTLIKQSPESIVIRKNVKLRSNPAAPPPLALDQLTMVYEFNGTETATLTLERSTGLPLTLQSAMAIRGKIRVVTGPEAMKGKAYPFSAKSTTTVELVKE